MGAGVVAELRYIPDGECVVGETVLDRLDDGELRLVEADVVVGDEAPGSGDRLFGRRAVACPGLGEVRKQRLDGRFGVAVQGDGVGLDPGEFEVVDVDVDQGRGFAGGVAHRETRSDADDDVRGLHHVDEFVHLLDVRAGAEARAVAQGMAIGYRALAAAGGDDGDAGRFGERNEGLFRARLRDSAADEDKRALGCGDDVGSFPQLFGTRHDARGGSGVPQLDLVALDRGLGGHLDEYGAGPSGAHLAECLGHGGGNVARGEHLPPPLGDGGQGAPLVHNLVDGAEVLADLAPGDLPGDEEHRGGAGVRGGHSCGCVVDGCARHHEGHTRLPGSASVAVGHVCGALLVAGGDHADARLVAQGGDDTVHVYAGDAEYDLDTLTYEGLHKGFAAAHLGHVHSPTNGLPSPAGSSESGDPSRCGPQDRL